jgi:enamine deaminase RidA (YjgF/YER057c/UK114 family)
MSSGSLSAAKRPPLLAEPAAAMSVSKGAAAPSGSGRSKVESNITRYVVDWDESKLPALGEGVFRASAALGIDPLKPVSLIGVGMLGEPDILVEIEATAVLD